MQDRVWIFDTTLRDGEQSPGCSMTVPEKLRLAAKLVELGVDIMEAGFPIASDGDFQAVDAISRDFPWVSVAALARCNKRLGKIGRASWGLPDHDQQRHAMFNDGRQFVWLVADAAIVGDGHPASPADLL